MPTMPRYWNIFTSDADTAEICAFARQAPAAEAMMAANALDAVGIFTGKLNRLIDYALRGDSVV